jgi:Asp-tRNA(Asn)/Glu-tRNA(Gln) amidotransferase B subunit
MVTNIGNTSANCNISDHATPASATYAWYIEGQRYTWLEKLPLEVDEDLALDLNNGFKMFQNIKSFEFDSIEITNVTDFDNLKKAIAYWEKNNTLLYISIKNGWGYELATWGTISAPTTLSRITGCLTDMRIRFDAELAIIDITFKHKKIMQSVV